MHLWSASCAIVLLVVLAPLAIQPALASVEPCSCEAERLGFTINCAARAFVEEAYNNLNTPTCQSACNSNINEECMRNWNIVQVGLSCAKGTCKN